MSKPILSSSSLTGNKVKNAQGESLGKIEDFMLDTERNCITYAVLSFGGFMGLGDKLFAVPMQALTLDTDDECFVLNVDKSRLEKAPGFDKDNWPDMANPAWANNIHSYYGVSSNAA